VAACGGFAALTAWLYRDVLAASSGVIRTGGFALERSDQLLHAWILDWVYHRLPRAPWALFDANIFWPHPKPLALSDHLFGVAVTLLPVRLLTAEPLRVNALGTVLTFVLAGVAVWALVIRLTGSRAAALVAGVLYAFNPFRLGNLDQVQLLTDYATPLAFLFLHRFQDGGRGRDLVALAAALAWQILCSAYLGAYLAPVLGVALLWGFARGRPRRRPPARAWLAAAGVGFVMLAPFLLPYVELGATLGLHQHIVNSVALSLPLDALTCTRGCGPLLGPVLGAGMVLALAGVVPGGGAARGVRSTYVLAALTALALAIGPYVHRTAPAAEAAPGFLGPGPYLLLWHGVPGFDGLRAPTRAVALVHLALAVLAGVGVTRVAGALGTPGRRRAAELVALAAAVVTALAMRPPLRVEPMPGRADAPPVYAALAADPAGGPVVELPMRLESDEYTYYSSFHRRPLVNGYSGVLPYTYRYIEAVLVCYPCAAALAALADLDVRTHVFHLEKVSPAARDGFRTRIAAVPELAVEQAFGDTLLLRFTPAPRPAPPAGLRAVARTAWRATSSLGTTDVERALDGDPATAWSTSPALDTLAEPRAGTRLLRGLESWKTLIALVSPGAQWFQVDLGAAHALRRATIELSVWDGALAAPAPVLEGSADGTAWVPGGTPTMVPSLRASTRHGPTATFAYELPATPLRLVRLRYQGYWALHDVALDE
jgi:hypothetical protein